MSNTTTKVNSLIYLGYSLLASQAGTNDAVIPSVEESDITEVPSYEDTTENILPELSQTLQTLIISSPTNLRI